MNFKNISNEELLVEAKEKVRTETAATLEVLNALREIDRRKAFADKAYPSLFDFCVGYLGYKRSAAYRRIMAMKAIKDLPELEGKIQSGALKLSTVSQAQTYFREQARNFQPLPIEKRREVLQSLENKSARETERFFLEKQAALPARESFRQLDGESYQFKANLPFRVKEKLVELRKLLGHSGNNLQNVDLIERALDLAIRQVKAKKEQAQKIPTSGKMKILWERDNGQCTFVEPKTKIRCPQTTHLEVDHIKPRGLGGDSNFENLRLLCRAHNQRAAIRTFGLGKMQHYLT